MNSQTFAKDPWSWNVDDLVAAVCRSSLFQAAGCRFEDQPDAQHLEGQLRDQEVTGATFLTALDSYTLRSELGILNLGQRTALLAVIDFLRQRSTAYRQHTATVGVQSLDINQGEQSGDSSVAGTFVKTDGRKRLKTTHIIPISLSASGNRAFLNSTPLDPVQDPTIVDGTGQWDHLLRWEQEKQHVISIDDEAADFEYESEDEGEDMEERFGSGEPEEVPVDNAMDIQSSSRLSRDEIVNIINERLDHYTMAWKPNHGVIKGDEVDYDPEVMWKNAEANNQRQQLIQKHETDVIYYKHRLDQLCEEILKSPGNTADRVRYQCRNLEVTVNSLELSEWLLSIYRLDPVEESGDDKDDDQTEDNILVSNRISNNDIPRRPALPRPSREQPTFDVIDLGSPPESSQDDVEDMLVDSSPPPEFPVVHPSSPHTDHDPDLAVAETIEPEAYVHPQNPETTTSAATSRSRGQLGDEPQHASIASARRWTWSDLISTQDRKRIVTKALYEMNSEDKETIRTRLATVGKAEITREMSACVRMLAQNETKIPGVLTRDMPKIVTLTRLFLCWWLCDNYLRIEPSEPQLQRLKHRLQQGQTDLSTFWDYLNTVMSTTFSVTAIQNPEQPSQAEIIEISDDDEPSSGPSARRPASHTQISQRRTTIIID